MFNSDFLITTYCLEPRQKHETYRSFVSEEIMWIQHHFFFLKNTFCFTQQSPEKTKGTLCSHTLFPCLATGGVGKFSSRLAEAPQESSVYGLFNIPTWLYTGISDYLITLQKDFIFHVIHVLLCLISFPGKSWGELRCIPGSSSCGQESNSTRSLRREWTWKHMFPSSTGLQWNCPPVWQDE